MTNNQSVETFDVVVEYPFRIHKVFFSNIDLKRAPAINDGEAIDFHADARLSKRDEPNHFQFDFRIRSNEKEDCPIALEIELIAIFESVSGDVVDRNLLISFLNHRLLYVATTMASSLLSQLTSQMGMSPIQLPYPLAFGFNEELIPNDLLSDTID